MPKPTVALHGASGSGEIDGALLAGLKEGVVVVRSGVDLRDVVEVKTVEIDRAEILRGGFVLGIDPLASWMVLVPSIVMPVVC